MKKKSMTEQAKETLRRLMSLPDEEFGRLLDSAPESDLTEMVLNSGMTDVAQHMVEAAYDDVQIEMPSVKAEPDFSSFLFDIEPYEKLQEMLDSHIESALTAFDPLKGISTTFDAFESFNSISNALDTSAFEPLENFKVGMLEQTSLSAFEPISLSALEQLDISVDFGSFFDVDLPSTKKVEEKAESIKIVISNEEPQQKNITSNSSNEDDNWLKAS